MSEKPFDLEKVEINDDEASFLAKLGRWFINNIGVIIDQVTAPVASDAAARQIGSNADDGPLFSNKSDDIKNGQTND